MNFDELYRLISEDSPMILGGEVDIQPDTSVSKYVYELSKPAGEYTYNGTKFEVRILKWNSREINYYFFEDKNLAAQCEGEVHDKQFWVSLAWQSPKYRGLVRSIYMTYLLDRYKMVVSDQSLTIKGVGMWKRFLSEPSLRVGVIQFGRTKPIRTIEQMERFLPDTDYEATTNFYITKR